MDFIIRIPTSEGKDSVFVVIDRLTKYAHFISMASKEKERQVACSYVKNIFTQFIKIQNSSLKREP